MNVSKEELLHIAKLANLNLDYKETDKYLENLQDILNFANVVNKAPIDGIEISNGAIDNCNVFRKDEVKVFEDNKALLQNAPEQKDNMFRVPKVLN